MGRVNWRVLAAFSLAMAVSFVPLRCAQPVRADWHLVDIGSFTRDLMGYVYFGWSGLTTDHAMRFDWVSGAVAVNFYIVDYTNLQKAIGGQSFYAQMVHEGVTAGDYSWIVVSAGTWYALWTGWWTQVAADYYLYEWKDPPNFNLSQPSQSSVSLLVGGTATVTMTLSNLGEESGQATVSVTSGEGIASTSISPSSPTLTGGASIAITLTIEAQRPGSVTLQVQASYGGTVHDTVAIQVTVNSLLGPPGPGGIPILVYLILAGGIAGAIVAIVVIIRRKKISNAQPEAS